MTYHGDYATATPALDDLLFGEDASAGESKNFTPSAVLGLLAPSVYNILNYGAVGNGTTDDTTAIQAAIDAAVAVGGIVLIPPTANSYIADGLVFKSNLNIRGYGEKSLIKHKANAAGHMITNNNTSISKINLYDLCFDGNKANQTDPDRDIMNFTYNSGSVGDVRVWACRWQNAKRNGIYCYQPGIFNIYASWFEGNKIGASWHKEHINLYDTYFWANEQGCHVREIGHQEWSNVIFAHNTVAGILGEKSGAELDINGCAVKNCVFIDNPIHIDLSTPWQSRITNCRFETSVEEALKVANPYGLQIDSNLFRNIAIGGGKSCILVETDNHDLMVASNYFYNDVGTGLFTYGVDVGGIPDDTSVQLIGNRVTNPVTAGYRTRANHIRLGQVGTEAIV